MNVQALADAASKVLKVAETLLALTPAGAVAESVLKIIKIATAIGTGIVQNVPIAIAAWDEMQAIRNSNAMPTPEQWALWDALADQAHSDLQAAVAAAQQ